MPHDGKRYTTRRVQQTLQPALQNMLWYLVETMAVEKKSDIQVFELADNKGVLQVTHIQERPEYHELHTLPGFAPLTATVLVVDEFGHCTMMLGDEY